MSTYAVASGTTNASGQSLSFAHGLVVGGVATTPDIVNVSPNSTSPSGCSATNYTTTTVDIYTTVINEPFKILAIKL